MTLWLDAHLSPSLSGWLSARFDVNAYAVRDLGLRDASDASIFAAARSARAVVVTKDADFVTLLDRLGPPPSVIWLTVGNTSNTRLREILEETLPAALRMLQGGESIVEIQDHR